MAKLIVTKDEAQTNILIELNDGSQIEVDVNREELTQALQNEEQTIIEVIQNQPEEIHTHPWRCEINEIVNAEIDSIHNVASDELFKVVAREEESDGGHVYTLESQSTGERYLVIEEMIPFSDAKLKIMWDELGDIPFDEDYETQELYLAEDWKHFKAGTWREDIWHWFDQQHSKGVVHLMYKNNV